MLGRNLVLCLSSAAILIGFIFLFVPLAGDVCGNAFGGGEVNIYLDSDVSDSICSTARVDRWQYVAPMLLGGIAALLAALNPNPAPTNSTVAPTATPNDPAVEG